MILVTGGTGMLGAYLLFRLIQQKKTVIATKRQQSNLNYTKQLFLNLSDDGAAMFARIEWVDLDLRNYERMLELMEGVQKVYHAAAMVSFDPNDRIAMIRNNIDSTHNLVNASLELGIKKFCYVSSITALGDATDNKPVDENTVRKPSMQRSGYSISKFDAELEVWRGIAEGLPAVIVNPSVILGAGNWHTGSPAFFQTINKGLRYYPAGGTGFVDARDVVQIMTQLMDSDIRGERFVLNAVNLRYKDFFSLIAQSLQKEAPNKKLSKNMLAFAWRAERLRSKIMHKKPKITRHTALSASKETMYSSDKVKNMLNYPFIDIEKTIAHTASLFLKKENNKTSKV